MPRACQCHTGIGLGSPAKRRDSLGGRRDAYGLPSSGTGTLSVRRGHSVCSRRRRVPNKQGTGSKMEYAREILDRSGKLKGRQVRSKRFVDSVSCAYCRGSGVDPKFGNTSKCSVCGATGRTQVKPPVITCLKCRGIGRESGNLTCLACRGTGVVSVREDATTCPKCRGTGRDGVFYCAPCKGQGIA